MKLRFWGTRGSVPVSGEEFARHGGCTTCIEIECPDSNEETPDRIIIDCGSGMVQLGRQTSDLEGALVLQTHMHWDHIQGFPFFAPLHDPRAAFDFWAVPREGQSLREVMAAQMSQPTFPIGLDSLAADLAFRDLDEEGEQRIGELKIGWSEMCHPSGSTAYRLEYDGHVFVFSGDVEVQAGCQCNLVEFARDADVLLMDAQYFPDEYEERKGYGHSTPHDAVEVADAANVGRVLMTHHDPSHDDHQLLLKLARARREASGRVLVDNAIDGMEICLDVPATEPFIDTAVG